MAFDGVTVAALTAQIREELREARVSKIAQPEADELIITFKTGKGVKRLLLSANASLPLAYFTDINKPSPLSAPGFCMLLRKHIGSARVVAVSQPSLERIIRIDLEHFDEMGDLCSKALIIELMGKHSNIIFCREEGEALVIIDAIKHVSALVSSVREVLPGREYFIPNTMNKRDPFEDIGMDGFIEEVLGRSCSVSKAIYSSFTGFSPLLANEVAFEAGVNGDMPTASLSEPEKEGVFLRFNTMVEKIRNADFAPEMIFEKGSDEIPEEFSALHLTMYEDRLSRPCQSISQLLEDYYSGRNRITRIRQRSQDLRRVAATALERSVKKYDLQLKQLSDTDKMEKYRIWGELLSALGHEVEPGASECVLNNYYTGEDMKIPLDKELSARENSRKYFERYQKLKRTKAALDEQVKETGEQIQHLESVLTSLDMALYEADLFEIRSELELSGYMKKKGQGRDKRMKSEPLHFVSSDGYDIYVGKNNIQNDYITFKMANSGDWWFHAKKMPGSHVIVKNKGTGEMPDRVFEEAAALAAYYSKGRGQTTVEVDYVRRKEVKKPAGAKPGFVVYYTNYSMSVRPRESI